jgi:hypothetical protein
MRSVECRRKQKKTIGIAVGGRLVGWSVGSGLVVVDRQPEPTNRPQNNLFFLSLEILTRSVENSTSKRKKQSTQKR